MPQIIVIAATSGERVLARVFGYERVVDVYNYCIVWG